MSHITKSKTWLFEIKAVRAIKCQTYGDKYTASASISIVDGRLHIENLITQKPLVLQDRVELKDFVVSLGFDCYYYSRFVDGVQQLIKQDVSLLLK